MPSPTHYKAIFFYLLFSIKSAYSNDDIPGSVTLPSYEEIPQISIPFYINGKTAYHFDHFIKIFRFEHNWVPIYDGYGEQTHVNVKTKGGSEDFKCSSNLKVYTYTAKNNVLFNMVNSGLIEETSEVIWAITDPVQYANKVVYDEADPNFLVVSIFHVNGKKTSFTKENGGSWKEFKITPSSNALSQDKIEVRIESQYTTPAVWIGNNEHYLKYSFYEGVKCLSVEYDKTKLLTTHDGLPNSPYPESVVFALKGNTAFVNFKEYIDILKFQEGNWSSIITGKLQPVHLSLEHVRSTDMFDYKNEGNVHKYTAKGPYLFVSFTKPGILQTSNKTIWSTTDYLDYANKVIYDYTYSNNYLIIYHVNGSIRTLSMSRSGKWYETAVTYPQSKQRKRIENPTEVPPPETEPPTAIPPPPAYTSKAVVENEESSPAIPNGVIFEKDKHLNCTLDDQLSYSAVDYGAKPLSDHDSSNSENNYSEFLDFSIKGNTAFVILDNSLVILRFHNNGWNYVYYGKREAHLLDIGQTSSNEFFIYNNEHHLHTFTATSGRLFCKVFIKHDSTDEVIWQTKHFDDVAINIVYDERNFNNKVVTIYHVNGFVRKFNKQSSGEWKETEVKEDESDLKPEKVEIRILSLTATPGVRIEKDCRYLKYSFDDGVKCLSVDYDGTQILKSSAYNIKYPESVAFTTDGSISFVTFKNSMVILRFHGNEWSRIYSGTGEGISINVLFKKSCDNYNCTNNRAVYTYTPKGDKLFNKIVRHPGGNSPEEVIFETIDRLDMVYQVVYDQSDPCSFIVMIYHVNGFGRKIHKCNFGLWANESWFRISKHNLEKLNEDVTLPPKPKHTQEQQTVDSAHLRSS